MDETRFLDLRREEDRRDDRDPARKRTSEADETGRGATGQGTTTAAEETPSTSATGLVGIPILGPLLAVLGALAGAVWQASTALGAVVYQGVRFSVVVVRRRPLVSVGLLVVAILAVLYIMRGG